MEISVESLLLELRELRAAVATALAPAPVSTLLLSEAWDQWLPLQSPQVQEKAASIWRCELHPILGDRPVVELIPSVLADWEAEMHRRGYAPKTISGAFALLSAACNLQVKNDRLPSLPWRAWRPRRPTVAKPRDAMRETSELSQLLKAAVAADVAAENRGYIGDLAKRICVASLQGLRQGELAGLGWEDVDFAAAQMHVRRQALDSWRRYYPSATRCPALPKGGKTRVLSMHPDVVDALDAQRARLRSLGIYADRGAVFPTRAGEWRSNGTCIRPEVFKALVAGLDWPADGFVPHALRHSAATMELRSGADLRNVQAKLGHSSIEVTELYLHADRVPPPSSIGRVRGVRW